MIKKLYNTQHYDGYYHLLKQVLKNLIKNYEQVAGYQQFTLTCIKILKLEYYTGPYHASPLLLGGGGGGGL